MKPNPHLTEDEYLLFSKLIQAMMSRLVYTDLKVYGKAYTHLNNAAKALDKIPSEHSETPMVSINYHQRHKT